MICNISRIKGFLDCRQKEYNREILRLAPRRDAEPLLTGGSYHKGIAHFFATGDVAESCEVAEKEYRERLEGQLVLEAEQPMLEREITIAKEAVRRYAEHYPSENFTLLMPEVDFCVPIPNSMHHCWYAHNLLFPDTPFEQCDYSPERYHLTGTNPAHCAFDNKPDKCWQPHYLRGTVDGLIQWQTMIWILEQKTSGIDTQNWWDQWKLDLQLSAYIYGTLKATGIRPQGALLNKIQKPRKNESIDNWLTKDIFSREPILRSDEDLARFEKEFILQCTDYENAMRTGNIYMNPSNCFDWNRACYYHSMCINHSEIKEGEFRTRELDYAETAYYKILNIEEKPNVTKEEVLHAAKEENSNPA
jgi:hypothetical protein